MTTNSRHTRIERETTITYNEAQMDAIIWSASKPVIRKLLKLGFTPYRQNGEGYWFKVPKRLVGIRKPYQADPSKPHKRPFLSQKPHEIMAPENVSMTNGAK